MYERRFFAGFGTADPCHDCISDSRRLHGLFRKKLVQVMAWLAMIAVVMAQPAMAQDIQPIDTQSIESSAMVQGECSAGACTGVLITRIVTPKAGQVQVGTSGAESQLTCLATGDYLYVDMSQPNAEALYSHILSMHLQQLPVTFRLNDTTSLCDVMYIYADL